MLKSVGVVSKELGISKAIIYKRLKEEEYKKLITKENGITKINDQLYELLKSKIKGRKVEEVENVEIVDKEDMDLLEVETKEENNNVVNILLKQIEEKDIQINRLHDLIENNQILIKNSQEREKEQIKLEEHFNDIDKKLIEIRDKNNSRKDNNKKSNILQRILKVKS